MWIVRLWTRYHPHNMRKIWIYDLAFTVAQNDGNPPAKGIENRDRYKIKGFKEERCVTLLSEYRFENGRLSEVRNPPKAPSWITGPL